MARSPRWLHRALLLGALALGAAVGPGPAAAQQAPSEREIRQSQQRLEEIRRERARLRAEMDRVRSRVHDLSTELNNIEQQVATSASLLRELDVQIEETQRQIHETTNDLITTQEHLGQRQGILYRRLRDIYKRGPLHTAQVLLAADSFSDLLNRYKYLYLMARRDRALVNEIDELKSLLVARERQLERSLRDLSGLQSEKSDEHRQLEDLESTRRRTLSSARTQERSTAQRISQLTRDEQQMTSLIATLERRRREAAERAAAERRRAAAAAAAAGRPAPAAPAAAAAGSITRASFGSLPWPVSGRLAYRFGRQALPNGTSIRWNGIGISATAGTAVRAVAPGKVVLASPFEGYGPSVVLDHGGGYYTLYLHLARLDVREGAEVDAGQTVGSVGGQATPQGAHIEFQLRTPGGQAVDPLPWLRPASR